MLVLRPIPVFLSLSPLRRGSSRPIFGRDRLPIGPWSRIRGFTALAENVLQKRFAGGCWGSSFYTRRWFAFPAFLQLHQGRTEYSVASLAPGRGLFHLFAGIVYVVQTERVLVPTLILKRINLLEATIVRLCDSPLHLL